MSDDIKKEVREAPCFWPLNPIVTYDEVYDDKIVPPSKRNTLLSSKGGCIRGMR